MTTFATIVGDDGQKEVFLDIRNKVHFNALIQHGVTWELSTF